ncbi:hypothetical protein PF001_g16991 [Phytophthora fragariae]|uniref:Uncharacterized protein n=1 Tax=Phytophthora fragariae TaxID=53985 RepID=A0A6A4CTP8_9STRA|nr:hypothetical protein PF003_g33362 [Phytophthora fragariae]KAE9296148.1 hypothetical protein PF001_g16991 [Phytophthora fragariae]
MDGASYHEVIEDPRAVQLQVKGLWLHGRGITVIITDYT